MYIICMLVGTAGDVMPLRNIIETYTKVGYRFIVITHWDHANLFDKSVQFIPIMQSSRINIKLATKGIFHNEFNIQAMITNM